MGWVQIFFLVQELLINFSIYSMTFTKAIPGLRVSDISQSLEFYQEKLGFDCLYKDNFFARLCVNDVELHLWAPSNNRNNSLGCKEQLQNNPDLVSEAYCRVQVSDLDILYHAYQVTGAIDAASTKIVRQPWGQKDFIVLDLCGNTIVFFEE